MLYQFLLKYEPVNSVCVWKMCHIENVVRSKFPEYYFFSQYYVHIWGDIFHSSSEALEIEMVYNILFIIHNHNMTILIVFFVCK